MAFKGILAANRSPWRQFQKLCAELTDMYFVHRLAGKLLYSDSESVNYLYKTLQNSICAYVPEILR